MSTEFEIINLGSIQVSLVEYGGTLSLVINTGDVLFECKEELYMEDVNTMAIRVKHIIDANTVFYREELKVKT